MTKKYLFSVLLGGKIRENHLMEDHDLVFVVAGDEEEARKIAKTKWKAIDVHVDGTQRINEVDGYKINLEKSNFSDDNFDVNQDYSK